MTQRLAPQTDVDSAPTVWARSRVRPFGASTWERNETAR
jgi:hypothetical protein